MIVDDRKYDLNFKLPPRIPSVYTLEGEIKVAQYIMQLLTPASVRFHIPF